MDIDEPINYEWPYEWSPDGIGKERPIVNRLMKAILEKNIDEMNRLFSLGATIKRIDKTTFKSALFHMLNDYQVVKCLVEHGFQGAYGDYEYYQECVEPEGYSWGMLIRSWYLGNYDIFQLLAQNGFGNLYMCSQGQGYNGEELIIRKNDVRAAIILLENGYPRARLERYANQYPQSDVIVYLLNNPFIHRTSIMLDDWKFKDIPYPKLEKCGLFNKKIVRQRNDLLLKDYEDRISAQKKFMCILGGEDAWNNMRDKRIQADKILSKVMLEIAGSC